MPDLQLIEYNAYLYSQYTILLDPNSDAEQIRVAIQQLYPELFNAQQRYLPDMMFYIQHQNLQASKYSFLNTYSHILPITYDSLKFLMDERSTLLQKSEANLRFKINFTIYLGVHILLQKLLLPLVNNLFLLPNFDLENRAQKLNALLNIFEYDSNNMGCNYCEDEFEVFAGECIDARDYELFTDCITLGIRTPDNAFFKKMQLNFLRQGDLQMAIKIGELLTPIASAAAVDLLRSLKMQQNTKRLTNGGCLSLYSSVNTFLFDSPININRAYVQQLLPNKYAELKLKRMKLAFVRKQQRRLNILEAIENLDYKTLNELKMSQLELEFMVPTIISRLQKLQKIDGKYRDKDKPVRYEEFIKNVVIDPRSLYLQVLNCAKVSSRLKKVVLQCIATLNLEDYCKFADDIMSDTISEQYLLAAAQSVLSETVPEDVSLLQLFNARQYAINNYGSLHYWAKYDGSNILLLHALLKEFIDTVQSYQGDPELYKKSAQLMFDENKDSFLHVLLKNNPDAMDMTLGVMFASNNPQLLYLIFVPNKVGHNIYNIIERDHIDAPWERKVGQILFKIISQVGQAKSMTQLATHLKDFFNNQGEDPYVAKLIESCDYKRLFMVITQRYTLRNSLFSLYQQLSGAFCDPVAFRKAFGVNDLFDCHIANLPAHKCLAMTSKMQMDNSDFQTIINSTIYSEAIALTTASKKPLENNSTLLKLKMRQ